MDKIGLDGVAEELEKSGFAKESIEKYQSLFAGVEKAEDGVQYLSDTLGEYLDADVMTNLKEIMYRSRGDKGADFSSWYLTRHWCAGCLIIPERSSRSRCRSSAAAVAGGGRYDKMVGKFTGQ